MERLGDQVLAHLGPVGVRGVDQVDAQLDDAPEEALGLLRVVRRAPDALPGDPHGAETKAVDLEVTADGEGVHAYDASDRVQIPASCDASDRYSSNTLLQSCTRSVSSWPRSTLSASGCAACT